MRILFLLLTCLLLAGQSLADKPVSVLMNTSVGDIRLTLYPEKAPKSVENFLRYINDGHYDGTIFHRVIKNFMIQGGGFTSKMQKKSTLEPIINEADNGLPNKVGSIAMARTGDPHSATAQFFINVKDNSFLDHTSKSNRGWGYTVFGEVTEGLDIVFQIANSRTTRVGGYNDVPIVPIVINNIKVIEAETK